ncbi:DNA repair protein RadC [Carnobacteriaceae bacterium zg-ZUI240]|nr:DNA repair protein RadC [Carnobacteriaceae bacterium zg-ZUI240]
MKKTSLIEQSQPRERLEQLGEQSLSTQELIAILLRTGTVTQSVFQVSKKLLEKSGGLYNLKNMSIEELQEVDGIGRVKAIELKAMIELGKRISQATQIKLGTIVSSESAAQFLANEMGHLQQEHFAVLFLNTKNHIIQKKILFIGSATRCIAEPREVFRHALKLGATKIIVAHNHPSGNPQPSHEDIAFTQRLIESGEMIGVTVLDHIIIGDGNYISFKQEHYI